MQRLTAVMLCCTAGCGRIGFETLQESNDAGLSTGGAAGVSTRDGGATGGGAGGSGGASSGGSDAASGGASGGPADAAADSGGGGAEAGATDAGATDGTTPPVPNHCQVVPRLAQPANIDGMLDAGMVLEPVVPVGWRDTTTPLPAGQSSKYAVGWRPDGVYFFVEVTDPDRNIAATTDPIWYGDCVELFLDHDGSFDTAPPDYDAVGTRQFFVQAPAVDGGLGTRAEIRIPPGTYNAWTTPSWHSEATTSGYVVEIFVDAAALDLPSLSLASGQIIGIDLAHDVSFPPGQTGPDGNRLSQYFLSVADPLTGSLDDYPYMDESVFCTPTLE